MKAQIQSFQSYSSLISTQPLSCAFSMLSEPSDFQSYSSLISTYTHSISSCLRLHPFNPTLV